MKNRHQAVKDRNTARLEASGIPFKSTNNGESLIVRQPWGNADFYPSTGKWKDLEKNKIRTDDFFAWCIDRQSNYKSIPTVQPRIVQGKRRKYFLRSEA